MEGSHRRDVLCSPFELALHYVPNATDAVINNNKFMINNDYATTCAVPFTDTVGAGFCSSIFVKGAANAYRATPAP